jgi:hypothetical protein
VVFTSFVVVFGDVVDLSAIFTELIVQSFVILRFRLDFTASHIILS